MSSQGLGKFHQPARGDEIFVDSDQRLGAARPGVSLLGKAQSSSSHRGTERSVTGELDDRTTQRFTIRRNDASGTRRVNVAGKPYSIGNDHRKPCRESFGGREPKVLG